MFGETFGGKPHAQGSKFEVPSVSFEFFVLAVRQVQPVFGIIASHDGMCDVVVLCLLTGVTRRSTATARRGETTIRRASGPTA